MKFYEIFNYDDETKDDEKPPLGGGGDSTWSTDSYGKLVQKYEGNKPFGWRKYTGLFETIVGFLTTCHTQDN